MSPALTTLAALRDRILALERPGARATGVLQFGLAALDAHLPEGGLALGALHEIAGGGADAVPAAAATLFAAGILARLPAHQQVVWCAASQDLFAPGLAAVVGELTRLPMVASRRLAMAAEKSGVMAVALRRRREGRAAEADFSAALTRWCVTPHPSAEGPFLGRARWHVALTRCRGGAPAEWIVEACDAQGCLAVPAALAHRQGAAA